MITNAVLTAVFGPPRVDGYGDETAQGDPVWEGRQSAYLTRRRVFTKTPSGGSTLAEVDLLILVGNPPVPLTPGDQPRASTVIVEDQRGESTTRRFRVASVDQRAIGSPVDSTRVVLADERTP